jgi:mRNA-degrading endonuclease RelE of RelBE toxin-antitoxin system
MKAVFVESNEFTDWVTEHLPHNDYLQLQHSLMDNPHIGDPIPGCSGLRKVRIADPIRGKGKRGGARVIYLYVPEAKRFFLLDIYNKDEQLDLTVSQKKQLSKLVDDLKHQATAAAGRRHQGK